MAVDAMMLGLYTIPKLEIDSGTDWVALCGSLAAVVAVVAGSWYNAHSFKKTILSQEDLAEKNVQFLREQSKSEFLARSRLEWIALFREHISSFLSLGASVYAVASDVVDPKWVGGDTKDEFDKSKGIYELKYAEYVDKLAKTRLHFAQIELLVSPNAPDSSDLINAMNRYVEAVSRGTSNVYEGQMVVHITRQILQREWNKVKDMKAL